MGETLQQRQLGKPWLAVMLIGLFVWEFMKKHRKARSIFAWWLKARSARHMDAEARDRYVRCYGFLRGLVQENKNHCSEAA